MTLKGLFFELLRCGLWNAESGLKLKTLQSSSYRKLMWISESQTVAGLIADCLMNGNLVLDKKDVMDVYGKHRKIESQNLLVNKELADFCKLFEHENIRFVIVKGQTVGALYPHSTSRMPGDIDVYVHPEDMEQMLVILEKEWSVSILRDELSKHAEGVVHNGVDFEIHRRLTDIYRKKGFDYWENLYRQSFHSCKYVDINEVQVPVLEPTLNVLYVFVHMFYHLVLLGVGLRQFCDMAVILHSCKSDIRSTELAGHLYALGLYDAFCAVGHVLVDVLGMPEDDFPFAFQPKHRKYTKSILEDVLKRGNFGKYNRKYNRAGWMHSLETGMVTLQHCFRYFPLASKELSWVIPKQMIYSVRLKISS